MFMSEERQILSLYKSFMEEKIGFEICKIVEINSLLKLMRKHPNINSSTTFIYGIIDFIDNR